MRKGSTIVENVSGKMEDVIKFFKDSSSHLNK
jgi:hypothetical protein